VNEIQEVYRLAPNAHTPRVGDPAGRASTSTTFGSMWIEYAFEVEETLQIRPPSGDVE
jgi:hypothetical protein